MSILSWPSLVLQLAVALARRGDNPKAKVLKTTGRRCLITQGISSTNILVRHRKMAAKDTIQVFSLWDTKMLIKSI